MTDIVERLRYAHKRNMPADDRLMGVAANEIARLRADLAAAEARGMERAAVIADDEQRRFPDFSLQHAGEIMTCRRIAAAIRAAAGEAQG